MDVKGLGFSGSVVGFLGGFELGFPVGFLLCDDLLSGESFLDADI